MKLRTPFSILLFLWLSASQSGCSPQDLHADSSEPPKPAANTEELSGADDTKDLDPKDGVTAPGQVAGAFLVKMTYFPKKSTTDQVYIGIRLEDADGVKATFGRYLLDVFSDDKTVTNNPGSTVSYISSYVLVSREEAKKAKLRVKVTAIPDKNNPSNSNPNSDDFTVVTQPMADFVKE